MAKQAATLYMVLVATTPNGGSGVDYFYGGNDTYIVDTMILSTMPMMTSQADTVKSLLTWQLDGDSGDYYDENTDLENLILTGSDPNGTGNSQITSLWAILLTTNCLAFR